MPRRCRCRTSFPAYGMEIARSIRIVSHPFRVFSLLARVVVRNTAFHRVLSAECSVGWAVCLDGEGSIERSKVVKIFQGTYGCPIWLIRAAGLSAGNR